MHVNVQAHAHNLHACGAPHEEDSRLLALVDPRLPAKTPPRETQMGPGTDFAHLMLKTFRYTFRKLPDAPGLHFGIFGGAGAGGTH